MGNEIATIRKIEWKVKLGLMDLEPYGVQDAGIQGEHNATEVWFELPEEMSDAGYLYDVEHVTAYGEYDVATKVQALIKGDTRPNPENSSNQTYYRTYVKYLLPEAWTQHGGEATLRLVAYTEGEDETRVTAFTAAGRIRYKKREGLVKRVSSVIEQSVRELLARCHLTAKRAEEAETSATAAAEQATRDAETATKKASAATEAATQAEMYATQAATNADTVSSLAPQASEDAATVLQLAPQVKSNADSAAVAAIAAEAAAEKAQTKVESLIERNNKLPVSLWVGTQAEYEDITDKDESRLYLISDDTEIEDLVKKHSAPHNLLDNSDFTNAVNQRGVTEKENGSVLDYFIDRWLVCNGSGSSTTKLVYGGLLTTVHSGAPLYQQRFKNGFLDLTNKVYTAVLYYADGTVDVYTSNGDMSNCFGSIDGGYDFVVVYPRSGETLSHIALYEGTYTEENVPAYKPKGYAAELAECQRYYRNINKGILNGYITGSGTYLWVSLPFTMRKVPDVTCYGTQFTLRTVEGYYNKRENIGAPTNCAYDDGNYGVLSMRWNNGDTLVKDTVTVNGVDVLANNNTPAALEIRYGGGIELSADY